MRQPTTQEFTHRMNDAVLALDLKTIESMRLHLALNKTELDECEYNRRQAELKSAKHDIEIWSGGAK